MKLERLTTENSRLLVAAQDEVLDEPVRPVSLDQFLNDPRHFMFLAIVGEQCVGMASAFEYFHPDKLPQIFLNEIGVSVNFERRGFGRALVRAVLDEACARGADYVWLGTEVDNLPARSCFAKVDPGEAWERDLEEPEAFAFYGWELDV